MELVKCLSETDCIKVPSLLSLSCFFTVTDQYHYHYLVIRSAFTASYPVGNDTSFTLFFIDPLKCKSFVEK
jgi:hypothetical protein